MNKILETERLILRAWKEDDREPFARMNADPIVMEYMPRILPPKDSNKLIERFEAHIEKHGYGMWALEHKETKAFIGTVGLHNVELDVPFTPAVEIAWRLDYGFWGQGYATEAARQVLDYASNDLKLKEVVAFSVHDNSSAIRIMEKLGMKRDEKGDFDYPSLRKGHPLGRFFLYRLSRKDYLAKA